MRAVGYCRFSSEQQRDGFSIEAQERAVREYCEKKGYSLSRFYVDEAKSGTRDDREQFQRMIGDAEDRAFDVIVVHKLDRFSRNVYDFEVYRKKLGDVGVQLVSVIEDFDMSKAEGQLTAHFMESLADYYSKNLSRETKKGMYQRARDGLASGGTMPLGYAKTPDGRRYQIDESRKAVAVEIFQRVASGETPTAIAKALTDRGVHGIYGGSIWESTVRAIVTNTLYFGMLTMRVAGGDPIRTPGAAPALVSEDLWRKANGELARMSKPRGPRKGPDAFPLYGLMWCGECGARIVGFSHFMGGKDKSYYRCSERAKGHSKCDLPLFRKELLEKEVFKATVSFLTSRSFVEWLCAQFNGYLDRRREGGDLASAKKEVEDIGRRRSRLADAYLSGDMPKDIYSARSSDLEKAYSAAKAKAASLGGRAVKRADPEGIRAAFSYYIEQWKDEGKRSLFYRAFIERIVAYPDRLEITFRTPLGPIKKSIGALGASPVPGTKKSRKRDIIALFSYPTKASYTRFF